MTDFRAETVSITDRVSTIVTGAPVIAIHFLHGQAAFVLSEEALLLESIAGGQKRIPLHEGAILSSAGDGSRIITGGDDGKVNETNAAGATRTLFTDPKAKWIDQVALGPDDAVAWSAGKRVQVAIRTGETKELELRSAAGGLVFAPKGFRLAIAHYNGASVWFPNAKAKPEILEWKGSHLGVTMSPDARFLITTMQEPMLHGWRLADGKHMRMSGYSARVRSMSWTSDGAFLATSGSDQLILWPFSSKDGPMGKQPTLLAPHGKRLVMIACHPKQPVVAIGYEDGLVLLVRLDDGAEVLVHSAEIGTPVTALAWSADGQKLAFACEDRVAGVVDLA